MKPQTRLQVVPLRWNTFRLVNLAHGASQHASFYWRESEDLPLDDSRTRSLMRWRWSLS